MYKVSFGLRIGMTLSHKACGGMSQGVRRDVTRRAEGCHKACRGMSQGVRRDVSRRAEGCLKACGGMSQGVRRDVSRRAEGCLKACGGMSRPPVTRLTGCDPLFRLFLVPLLI